MQIIFIKNLFSYVLPFPAFVGFRFSFTFVIVSPRGICRMHYFSTIIIIPIGENFIIRNCCQYQLPQSRRASVFFITNKYVVFLFCFLFPMQNLSSLSRNPTVLSVPDLEANFHKHTSSFSSPSSSQAVINGNFGNVIALSKFFIPSLIGFNSLL